MLDAKPVIGKPFTSEYQPANPGYPKGRPRRDAAARKICQLLSRMPDATFEKIKEVFPDIERALSAEEVMTLSVMHRAIVYGDVNAYKAILDSAYGPIEQPDKDQGKLSITINISSPQTNDTIDLDIDSD
jgi:hypothetical protein